MKITDERIRFAERMFKRASTVFSNIDEEKATTITVTAVITAAVTIGVILIIKR